MGRGRGVNSLNDPVGFQPTIEKEKQGSGWNSVAERLSRVDEAQHHPAPPPEQPLSKPWRGRGHYLCCFCADNVTSQVKEGEAMKRGTFMDDPILCHCPLSWDRLAWRSCHVVMVGLHLRLGSWICWEG